MIGGLRGSLLFGGLGGGLGSGPGIGLFDMLLIGGGLFLLFRLMRCRRQEPAYAGAPGYTGATRSWDAPTSSAAVAEPPPVVDDIDRGLGHVRQLDPGFDAAALAAEAAQTFREVQTAVSSSRHGPDRFEEFWTFTRPVGPNAWKLTAIQTA